MIRRGEGHLFPVGEQPEARPHLQVMTEGKQIAFLHYLVPDAAGVDPLPPGWCGAAMEFTSGDILMILSCPTLDDLRYRARLAFRWIPPQVIWTKRMHKRYSSGRDPTAASADAIARQVEGEMITGIANITEPNVWGGEQMRFHFTDGRGLHVMALPSSEHPMVTELDLRVTGEKRMHFGMMV